MLTLGLQLHAQLLALEDHAIQFLLCAAAEAATEHNAAARHVQRHGHRVQTVTASLCTTDRALLLLLLTELLLQEDGVLTRLLQLLECLIPLAAQAGDACVALFHLSLQLRGQISMLGALLAQARVQLHARFGCLQTRAHVFDLLLRLRGGQSRLGSLVGASLQRVEPCAAALGQHHLLLRQVQLVAQTTTLLVGLSELGHSSPQCAQLLADTPPLLLVLRGEALLELPSGPLHAFLLIATCPLRLVAQLSLQRCAALAQTIGLRPRSRLTLAQVPMLTLQLSVESTQVLEIHAQVSKLALRRTAHRSDVRGEWRRAH
mmetsp:Transcript_17938/g.53902  ORF Transcript_17938/g.53902 Transcript_17938/m.53902 type:complete len:318 (-) Transcript_17938:692-1645(-)